MIRHYFKIAKRNLWRNKGYSVLNIGGLAIGMAAAILILLWIQNEVSFDRFHTKRDRLHMVGTNVDLNGEINTMFLTPKPLAPALKAEFPEIVNVSRYSDMGKILMTADSEKLKGHGVFVDSAFLQMFDFPLVRGSEKQALVNPTDIVITQSLAKRLFGSDDVIGKTVKLENADPAIITGVMKDTPKNTRFNEAEFFMPWSYMEKKGESDEHWGNNTVITYLELAPGTSFATINSKIQDITTKHREGKGDTKLFLQALPDWWLYTKFVNGEMVGGKIDMVQAYLYIAGFILLIACINFMNLSTASSEKRAKEVGVRKVAGAYRYSLILQFLCEAIMMAFIAGALALLMVWLCLPAFNELLDRKVMIDFTQPVFWISFFGFILITGLLAGSYPAFFLSSFQPAKVLKGTFKNSNATFSPRRLLVAIQFTVAIALVICTLIIQRQLEFGRDRENGYNKNNLIYLYEEGAIKKNMALIKHELLSSGVAESVTRTSSPLTENWSSTWGFGWQGKDQNDKIIFDMISADDQFVKTAGLSLVSGRDFDIQKYASDSAAVILNESAVKAMGFKDPLGQLVQQHGRDWKVVGVVKDFILNSPFEAIPPMVILGAKGWFNIVHIKFNPSLTTSTALERTEAIFKKYNSEYPFEYTFLDEAYAQKFTDTQRYGVLAGLFTMITITISCLGLFALSAFMAENRKKEIGIRKVLGASVFAIARLLSLEFVILVLVSCLIAFPISYLFTERFFLQMYTYRVPIGWSVFVLSGTGILVLALITVSTHAIKAALSNPVTSLKDE